VSVPLTGLTSSTTYHARLVATSAGGTTNGPDLTFTTGDLLKVNQIQGTVERIGLRSTRIRTIEKTYVTVPNKQMVDSVVDNLTLRTQRRGELRLDRPARVEAMNRQHVARLAYRQRPFVPTLDPQGTQIRSPMRYALYPHGRVHEHMRAHEQIGRYMSIGAHAHTHYSPRSPQCRAYATFLSSSHTCHARIYSTPDLSRPQVSKI
jgi:hypothetical protein